MEDKLKELYEKRFEGELRQKNNIWKILCSSFFQKYIDLNDIVLDIGAGYCEFINNINCSKKYAVDLNQDILNFADSDVQVHICTSTSISPISDSSIDTIFMSNFLEHLKSKEDVLTTLMEIYRVLKSEGKVMILQPNIKYAYKEYWDFFDHYIPLSDKSLVEALQIAGLTIELVVSKFLPFSTKSRIPQNDLFIKTYLKLPVIWKVMGKQMFIIATKVKT